MLGLAIAIALTAGPASAQDRGPVTNLPIPRFVSLKASTGNMRRGPSMTHKIDWVLTRRDMPLEVIGEYGHWRRVRDRDGATGWIHYSLISGARTAIVEDDLHALRARDEPDAIVRAYLEAGVIVRLGECKIDWCKVTTGSFKGWIEKSALWGVGADEIRE